jgi:hypothetical protein
VTAGGKSRGSNRAPYSSGYGSEAGSRNSPDYCAGFNKNIKKSGLLIMGDRGLVLVLLVLVLA